jgi:hypothetical protein
MNDRENRCLLAAYLLYSVQSAGDRLASEAGLRS